MMLMSYGVLVSDMGVVGIAVPRQPSIVAVVYGGEENQVFQEVLEIHPLLQRL
jgi:hypothetical protein